MNCRLTVGVDNIPQGELAGEWGLSILAEYGQEKVLVDVGASDLFAENYRKLGFDLAEVDYAVLSHAHYDHANGMREFFRENEKASFYLREGSGEDCYSGGFFHREYVGLPRGILKEARERIVMVSGDYSLTEGIRLIPHKTPGLAVLGKREQMYRRTGLWWKTDDFAHEQSVVMDTDRGLVIINCCSHGGAANIISEVAATFPDRHVYGLIGGFHLYNKTEDEVRLLARKIRETGIDFVCTGHCTGGEAYRIMEEELGEKLSRLHTGLVMEF